MAQATVPALPAQAIFTPQSSTSPRSVPEGNGDNQAFAKALEQRRNGASDPGARPRNPDSAMAPANSDTTRGAGKPPQANASAATQGTASDAPPPQNPTTPGGAVAEPDGLATLTDTDRPSAETEDDATSALSTDASPQASLAGLPAALAALLAGQGATASGTPPAPQATSSTQSQALENALRSPSRERANGSDPATVLTTTAEPLPDEAPSPLPGGFAQVLDSIRETDTRPPVLPAVLTETGPASRAAEAAQLAAATSAGDAAASPAASEATPGAGLPWNPIQETPGHRNDAALRLQVTQPPDHPAWAESVGNRITWMVGQKESTAELVLTPPQLGRVEVTLTTNGEHTHAQFVAATPAAREVLEQAMPRLREVLANAGITLTDSGVSTSNQGGARGESNRQDSPRQEASVPPTGASQARITPWLQRGQGLVDTFA